MLKDCREYRPELIEMARGTLEAEERAALLAHLDVCADCGRVLDEQAALSMSLDAMAGEAVPAMKLVEARVLAEFDRVMATRRGAAWVSRWIPAIGLAAAALLGVVLVERRTTVAERPPARETVETEAAILPAPPAVQRAAVPIVQVGHKKSRKTAGDDNLPFLPIPYTVPPGPEERTTVVRMEIPVAALIAAGFNIPVVDPGGLVLADVLVGQDGRARAIRPVRASAGK